MSDDDELIRILEMPQFWEHPGGPTWTDENMRVCATFPVVGSRTLTVHAWTTTMGPDGKADDPVTAGLVQVGNDIARMPLSGRPMVFRNVRSAMAWALQEAGWQTAAGLAGDETTTWRITTLSEVPS